MKKKFGRFACLGRFTLSKDQSAFDNYQKLRIDIANNRFSLLDRIYTSLLAILCVRDVSVTKMILKATWFRYSPRINYEVCVFDVFSELADSRFIFIKNSVGFCCAYSDLNYLGRNILKNLGRISQASFIKEWYRFHQTLMSLGCKKIIILTYPTFRETRDDYIAWSKSIEEALTIISYEKQNIQILPEALDRGPPNTDDPDAFRFPYHYSEAFYIQTRNSLMPELSTESVIDGSID